MIYIKKNFERGTPRQIRRFVLYKGIPGEWYSKDLTGGWSPVSNRLYPYIIDALEEATEKGYSQELTEGVRALIYTRVTKEEATMLLFQPDLIPWTHKLRTKEAEAARILLEEKYLQLDLIAERVLVTLENLWNIGKLWATRSL